MGNILWYWFNIAKLWVDILDYSKDSMPKKSNLSEYFYLLKIIKMHHIFFWFKYLKQLSFYASDIQKKTFLEGHKNLTLVFIASFVLK